MSDDPNLPVFLQLSEALTGVKVSSFDRTTTPGTPAKPGDLRPRNSPIDLAPVYLQLLQSRDRIGIESILKRFSGATAEQAPGIIRELLNDTHLGPICHSIIKLWYLGVWYSPAKPGEAELVVSPQAYIESLVWKVAQAHPAGYSLAPFGHWADDPPPLSEFITLVG
jgi:hypothetical protein